MPLMTVGEYKDPAEAQREMIRETEIDLSSGQGSLALDPLTRSVRVCSDVTHRFVLGVGKATAQSQRRPAEGVERHDVIPGQGWAISVVVEG